MTTKPDRFFAWMFVALVLCLGSVFWFVRSSHSASWKKTAEGHWEIMVEQRLDDDLILRWRLHVDQSLWASLEPEFDGRTLTPKTYKLISAALSTYGPNRCPGGYRVEHAILIANKGADILGRCSLDDSDEQLPHGHGT